MHQIQSESFILIPENSLLHEFNVLQWLPQSTDMNPTVHLWYVQEQEIHSMNMYSSWQIYRKYVCEAIMSVWVTVSLECVPRRNEFPQRNKFVLKAKEGPPQY